MRVMRAYGQIKHGIFNEEHCESSGAESIAISALCLYMKCTIIGSSSTLKTHMKGFPSLLRIFVKS